MEVAYRDFKLPIVDLSSKVGAQDSKSLMISIYDSNSEVLVGVTNSYDPFMIAGNTEFYPNNHHGKAVLRSTAAQSGWPLFVVRLKCISTDKIESFEYFLRILNKSKHPFPMKLLVSLLEKGLCIHLIGATGSENGISEYFEKLLFNGFSYPNGRSIPMDLMIFDKRGINQVLEDIRRSSKDQYNGTRLSKFIHNNLSKLPFANSKREFIFH